MTHVGKKIRHIRKKMRMTQEELAEGICNRSYVSQIEKGNVVPSPEILEQLAIRLKTELKELWVEVENPGFTQVEIQNSLRHIINGIEENDWEIARKWLLKLLHVELSPVEKGIFLWAKAKIYYHDNRLDEVEALLHQSIVLSRESDDPIPLIRALNSLGLFYCRQLKASLAVPLLNEALQLANRYNISGLVRISLLHTTSIMHARLGEYYSAFELLKQAEHLNQSNGTMYKSGPIFNNLAICYHQFKKYEEADKYNQLALATLQFTPYPQLEASTYTNMGILELARNNLELAEKYQEKAVQIHQTIGDSIWQYNSMTELAKIYHAQGRIEEAKKLCETVLNESTTEFVLAEAKITYSEILYELDEPRQALIYLAEAFEYFAKVSIKKELLKCYQALVKISTKHTDKEEIIRLTKTYTIF